jgi:hypothetical protein
MDFAGYCSQVQLDGPFKQQYYIKHEYFRLVAAVRDMVT